MGPHNFLFILHYCFTDESLYSDDSLDDFWKYRDDNDYGLPDELFYGDHLVCTIIFIWFLLIDKFVVFLFFWEGEFHNSIHFPFNFISFKR